MTIEKLLALPTDELGRLTSDRQQLDAILTPYLPFTRPATRRSTVSITVKGASGAVAAAMNGTLFEEPTKKKLLKSNK